MIDLSNLKAPGWQRIVAELSAPAPDDRTFLLRLLASLTQVSGARQGVLMLVDRSSADVSEGGASGGSSGTIEPRPLTVWPPTVNAAGQPGDVAVESPKEAKAAAIAASEDAQIRVFGLEDQASGFYESSPSKGVVVAVPVALQPESAAAETVAPKFIITLLIESRSRQAMQATLAQVEVLAGYVHGHTTRQQYRRSRAAAAAMDLAGRLLSAVNYAPSFKGAAIQLCNDLARQLKADRVALGWVHGVGESGAVRVESMSDTEHIDRRLAMIQKIEAAMDECLDQEQPIVFPVPTEPSGQTDSVLGHAITNAHRGLASTDARITVVSVPLRCEIQSESRVLGVLTIESTDGARVDSAGVEVLQATMDLIAPALRLRRSDDRTVPARAWASMIRGGRWAVGPKHTAWKLAGLVGLVGLVLASTVPVTYRVDAPLTLEPREMRSISVPFEGTIKSLGEGIEPSAVVKAGQSLVMLDTTEIELQALETRAQIDQFTKQADALRSQPGKAGEIAQAEARAAQYRAKLGLLEYRIAQATIKSPIDGTILVGDLKDRIGSSLKQGDVLFQIAPLNSMVGHARVRDSDVGFLSVGGAGVLATKAQPDLSIPFTVEQVVPPAQPKDGVNAFEVRVRIDAPTVALQPGMEGLAKFEAGRHSLMWIASRRILDSLRLWLWW